MKISISHSGLQEIVFFEHTRQVAACKNCNELSINLNMDTPTMITAQFQPYGIKPLLRIDGFLIDYWLANVLQQDHQISFELTPNFVEHYRSRDRQGRIDSLSDQQRRVDHYLDKYIGIDNLNSDLLVEIRDLLDEKPSIHQSSKN